MDPYYNFKKSLLSYFRSRLIILIITSIYSLLILLLVVNRFWQFEAFYYNQGYYESSVWNISRFKPPIVDHQALGRVNIFADHFIPSIFLLSPLYWFTKSYLTTPVAVSIGVGISVLIAYEIASKLIRSRFLTFSLLFAYMFFVGLQNALITFLDPIVLMTPFLMFLFWTILNDKIKLFYPIFLINLGFKETVASLGLTLGIFLFFYKKSWKKHGLKIILISITYALLVTRLIIPRFAPSSNFFYEPNWILVLKEFLPRFFFPLIKTQTIFASLAAFGFLPLFIPFFLPLILQDFILRFVVVYQSALRWDLGLHYNANLAVLLFVGSVLSVHKLQDYKFFKKVYIPLAIFIIFITIIFHRFVYHGPFGLLYNPEFYKHTGRQQFMWDFINKIPKEGKIMTQSNLAVFFTHEDLYIIRDCQKINRYKPDVIAFDIRSGQNPNNLFPTDEKTLRELTKILDNQSGYSKLFDDGSRYIYTKRKDKEVVIKCPQNEY